MVHLFLSIDGGLIGATIPEDPVLDAAGVQDPLHLRAASEAGPQGNLKPQENIDVRDRAVGYNVYRMLDQGSLCPHQPTQQMWLFQLPGKHSLLFCS